MTTIESQITAWEQMLLTAGDPNELAKAKSELKRLKAMQARRESGAAIKIKVRKKNMPVKKLHAESGHAERIVFIIHGHDLLMKREVQLFINRCGLTDMVGHEEADMGRTIIEKLLDLGDRPLYAIALLSPDDVQADGTIHARQNVILEIGFFIAKLGRDKVRLLRKPNTIVPTDLSGILHTNYDEEGAWKMKLAKEMIAVGIQLDNNEIFGSA